VKSSGQELYEKALKLIPGGVQLLSKRPELLLPEQWPSYYSKAKGIDVWDLDGNKYQDMISGGIGACSRPSPRTDRRRAAGAETSDL